jgi:hypothetical protein
MTINCSIIQSTIISKISGGSAIEYYDNKLMLIGDDAKYLGVLNLALETVDTITLWQEATETSIPKNEKADLEASCIIDNNGVASLFAFGSGSKADKRNWVIEINVQENAFDIQKHENHNIYKLLKATIHDKVNIEAAEYINPYLILGNRGNKKEPSNHLIYINAFNTPSATVNKMISIKLPKHNNEIPFGISGLCKLANTNYVLATFSSEDTDNAIDDGAIGPSAIAIFSIDDIMQQETITPISFQLLETFSSQFKQQKIESVCIVDNILFLVADNDNHESTLFKCQFTVDND